jgi:hypothetical protein
MPKETQPPGTKEGKELVPLLYKANWETSGIFFFLVWIIIILLFVGKF